MYHFSTLPGMKRLLLMGVCLALAGCQVLPTSPTEPTDETSQFPVALEFELQISDADHRDELRDAAVRTVERRLAHLGMEHGNITLDDADAPHLRVRVQSSSGAAVLTARLQDPFSVRFMREVSVDEANATPGGLVVADSQGFVDTGLNETHLSWVSEETSDAKSRVTVGLTTEGRRLKARIFREQMGGNIGLFVRNQPVYKLTVEQADLDTEDVIIMIPDPALSPVFVDDLNVSNIVTFVPVSQS